VYKKTDGKEEIYIIANFSEFDTVFERSLFGDLKEEKIYNLITESLIAINEKNFISAYDILWLRK
jgi:amylosucrase